MNKESSSWAIILGIFLQNRPTTASFLFYFCSFLQHFYRKIYTSAGFELVSWSRKQAHRQLDHHHGPNWYFCLTNFYKNNNGSGPSTYQRDSFVCSYLSTGSNLNPRA